MSTQQHHNPTEDELAEMTEDELTAWADTEFDAEPESVDPDSRYVEGRRNHVLSVRFSATELDQLREQAEKAGMKVTTYVRTVVLQKAWDEVVDLEAMQSTVADLVTQLRISVDAAKARRAEVQKAG